MATKARKAKRSGKGSAKPVGGTEAAGTVTSEGRSGISREAVLHASKRMLEHLPTDMLCRGLPVLAEHATEERRRWSLEMVVDWPDVPLEDFFPVIDLVDWPRIAEALERGKAACVAGGLKDGCDESQWKQFGYGRLGCVNVHIEFRGRDVWFLPRSMMEGVMLHDPLSDEN